MPTTRSMRSLSSLGRSATPTLHPPTSPSRPPRKSKRKTQDTDEPPSTQSAKKPRVDQPSISVNSVLSSTTENELLPAVLTFSLEDAKQHLIRADSRFKDMFDKLPCRPFEHLERVDPFRTLVTSIVGQQISWLAARSVTHKFIRLFDPSLPEKPPPLHINPSKVPQTFFPSATQVASTDTAILRSAGLSTRKAEYVQDLATRFADGRLTNKMLIEADDEELARLLIEVRGIGRWTVDMFALFSLRRPDILPVGDLGVQRGVARWFLSLHSPFDAITISLKKLPKAPGDAPEGQGSPARKSEAMSVAPDQQQSKGINGAATAPPGPLPTTSLESAELDVSSLPPVPVTPVKGKGKLVDSPQNNETPLASPDKAGLDTGSMPMLPEPFTPSINKTLQGPVGDDGKKIMPAPLPEGITVESLKARLNGKKKIKGSFLTPKEMEEFTEPWRPYRSLGVFYMWALAEGTTSS